MTGSEDTPALRELAAHYQSMPPVVAIQARIAGYDGERLHLQAPLAANVNDKGCAFGGSLSSLMTLAGWGLVTLRLQEAGLEAPVYVADSNVRFRVPLFADLHAEAWLQEGDWDSACADLRSRGRASLMIASRVGPGDGSASAVGSARYVAMLG
ncbi:YiiD C-terminal domain-containing protein [Luteimonas sp. 8-5]|uniref:YiiD C-terminal domain-containing protein n=1 Tax=Luteimonas sp. 8-5 TaxID=3039387 RepID=UPI0024367505|nr:YiiD C-terminal domain-containing protein [Luteimonas sp. 8-5]MDG6348788.1 YiiD C-terminal domain-containing protein [Luteimonas sp. 8-5]